MKTIFAMLVLLIGVSGCYQPQAPAPVVVQPQQQPAQPSVIITQPHHHCPPVIVHPHCPPPRPLIDIHVDPHHHHPHH